MEVATKSHAGFSQQVFDQTTPKGDLVPKVGKQSLFLPPEGHPDHPKIAEKNVMWFQSNVLEKSHDEFLRRGPLKSKGRIHGAQRFVSQLSKTVAGKQEPVQRDSSGRIGHVVYGCPQTT